MKSHIVGGGNKEKDSETTREKDSPSGTGDEGAAEQGARAACSASHLDRLSKKMACDDLGDGCHSCVSRTKWIIEHEGLEIDKAFQLIAAEFPEHCGDLAVCTAELHSYATLNEAWSLHSRLGVSASTSDMICLFTAAVAALAVGAIVFNAWGRRRPVRQRHRGPLSRRRASERALGIAAGNDEQELLL